MATTERTELDPLFKQILVSLGQTLNFTPKTQVEVSRLPRTIDVVIELLAAEDQARLTRQTPFIRLRQHNQIEFKGRADRLSIPNYQLIRGRSLFYMSEHRLLPSQMSISIVCASKPNKVLKASETVFQNISPGYYLGNEQPPTLIIVINELPMTPKNYPLLLFTSSKKLFRSFLQVVLAEESHHVYLQYAYFAQPTIAKEEIMSLAKSAYITQENLAFIAQDIGDELMPLITDEAMIQKSPAFQKLFASEKQQQKQRLLQDERQRTLLRLLRYRFSSISAELEQRIKATTDLNQLEIWLDKVLEVKDLAEFERLM